MALVVKYLPAKARDVRDAGGEDLQEGMATRSSILAWRIPWAEEPAELWSIGSQSVRHDWSDLASTREAEGVQRTDHCREPQGCGLCCQLLQSCLTLWDPMDCSLPGSSVHGILQARILEWVAMPSSRGSSQPRDRTWVSCTAGGLFTH